MYSKSVKISQEYEILIKNFSLFENKTTIISGLIPSQLFHENFFKKLIIYTQYYDVYKMMYKKNIKKIILNLTEHYNPFYKYQQLIYFWTKNKSENNLQLTYLLSCISSKCIIYIIGKKKSGINSVPKTLKKNVTFKKKSYARSCCLYKGNIKKKPQFLFQKFIKTYTWKNIRINSLPGVFGYKKIDKGSKLLISTFKKDIQGKILDVGSGTGIIGIALAKNNPKINLTLTDNYNLSIWCSKNNLLNNNIKGKVLLSDVYSNIKEKYNLIISNPPIHSDRKINLKVLNIIIKKSKKYLKKNGEIRIVVNSFISCELIFNKNKMKYEIIKKNKSYKVIKAFIKNKFNIFNTRSGT
ncbi:methyltransferase [Buchnera aphidicola]|uniref:Ribosomal RNA small subunit methyltransferase C n=1 Tax=Buchnera aphidicola (Cinara strobi) TaxID=1921549 RepID=A0A3B1E0N9_9GAMM|nr:methyltransferase [Buchnera aphidicola]VAX76585.1 Ribosomal RNA small subunit methyltransferase C [Buchnera aphidicola (Cinara strobi)]